MKKKIIDWVIIILLALIGICVFNMISLAQTFSNSSKPYNAGTYSAANAATIQFYLQTDTGFHKNRSATIFEWGNIKCYVQYPELRLGSISQPLDGMVGYPHITTGRKKWTVRFGDGKAEVLIDTVLILSKPYTFTPINSALWFSSNSDIDKLSGTISNFTFSPTYTKIAGETQLDPVYDWRNLPESGMSCYDQLVNYPAPKYVAGSYPRLHPMFDFYKAGGEDWAQVWGITSDSVAKAGVAIAKILYEKFNCDIRVVGNTQDYISYMNQPNSPHGKFNQMMIDMANQTGTTAIRVDCSLSQLDDIGGYRAITTAETESMLPNMPLDRFQDEANILQIHYSTIQSKLTQPIKYALVDNEYMPADKWLDTVKYQSLPDVRAAKEASGLSWRDYCSKQYTTALNTVYDGIRRGAPGIQVIEYDVNALDECGYYYDPEFKFRVGLNKNNMGSEQVYPRSMYRSLIGAGDYRGVLNSYLLNKRGQIKDLHPSSTPFVGVGYLGDYTKDMNPTSTIGMETFLFGCGSPSMYPALYVQGGNNPDPASYAYQMASASYGQAAVSKCWDIVINGTLLQGDRNAAWLCYGGTSYSFWTGDYETVCVVKQLGTRHLITLWRSAASNMKVGIPYKRDVGIWLNGLYIPLASKWQGSTYEYDSSKPLSSDNPKMLNQWVKFGDPNNWE